MCGACEISKNSMEESDPQYGGMLFGHSRGMGTNEPLFFWVNVVIQLQRSRCPRISMWSSSNDMAKAIAESAVKTHIEWK